MVQKYIRENYDAIIEIAKVITQARYPDFEDLAHEVILAFVDVGVEYYLYQGIRVNEMIIALLGVLYLCL